MASTFPTSVDSFFTPTPTTEVTDGPGGHAGLHNAQSDAITAVESYLKSPTMPAVPIPNAKVTNLDVTNITQQTAKGDLLVRDTAWLVRMPAGPAGTVLASNPSVPGGLEYVMNGANITQTAVAGENIPDNSFVISGFSGIANTYNFEHKWDLNGEVVFWQISPNPAFVDVRFCAFDISLRLARFFIRENGTGWSTITAKILDASRNLVCQSTNTIADGSTSNAEDRRLTFNFPQNLLTRGSTYFIRIETPTADNTNYYKLRWYNGKYSRALPVLGTQTGYSTIYTDNNFTPYFFLQFCRRCSPDKCYLRRESFEFQAATGFVKTGVSAGSTATITSFGSVTKPNVLVGQKHLKGLDRAGMEELRNMNVGWSNMLTFGYATNDREKYAEMRMFSTDIVCTYFSPHRWNLNGSHTDSFVLRIETDNAWLPSGTLADANATITIPWTMANDNQDYTRPTFFAFPATFVLYANTPYHFVISKTGTPSTTNNYSFGYRNNSTMENPGYISVYDNGSWKFNNSGACLEMLISGPNYWYVNFSKTSFMYPGNTGDTAGAHQIGNDYNIKYLQIPVLKTWYIKNIILHMEKTGNPVNSYSIRLEKSVKIGRDYVQPANLQQFSGTWSYFAFGTTTIQKVSAVIDMTASLSDYYLTNMWRQFDSVSGPSDYVTLRVESDIGGVPSGNLIVPNAEATLRYTIAWAGMHYFVFKDKVKLSYGAKYHFVLVRTWSLNNVSYPRIESCNDSNAPAVLMYNWTSWVNYTGNIKCVIGAGTRSTSIVGIPTGELCTPGSEITLNPATVMVPGTNNYTTVVLTLPTPAYVEAGNTYFLKFDVNGNPDGSNYLMIGYRGNAMHYATTFFYYDVYGVNNVSRRNDEVTPFWLLYLNDDTEQNLTSMIVGQKVWYCTTPWYLNLNFVSKSIIQRLSTSFFANTGASSNNFSYTPQSDGILFMNCRTQTVWGYIQVQWADQWVNNISDVLFQGGVASPNQALIAYPVRGGKKYTFMITSASLTFYYFQS